jgi:hypothetical protein
MPRPINAVQARRLQLDVVFNYFPTLLFPLFGWVLILSIVHSWVPIILVLSPG